MRLAPIFFTFACMLFAADRFTGQWSSSQNEAAGTIDIQLSEPAQVTFTLQGQEVKTKILSAKREDSKFELRYEFDFNGTRLISTINGAVAGDKAEGTYRTTTAEGDSAVDGGTFTASVK